MGQSTNTFRVFVSSTFHDLKEERNALQRYVFPRLRELCQRSGCRFQAIDLRWGIRDEATLDQQAMRICLEEIARCQRVTPRPNFIVLLGDRYGSRLLPWAIPAGEFAHIEKQIGDGPDKSLLEQWYKRDDNAVPPVYDLQPRTGKFTDRAEWKPLQQKLHSILLKATADLNDDTRTKYWASATEQEIKRGALAVPDARHHVFGFFRTIENLPHDISASDYVDLDARKQLDSDAQSRLNDLKLALKLHLPDGICEYRASWTGTQPTLNHLGTLPDTLDECLKLREASKIPSTLCVDVWLQLSKVILEQIGQIKVEDPITRESKEHEKFSRGRTQCFAGRQNILETIRIYIGGKDRNPLVIWGQAGSGKTSLLGKAHENYQSQFPNHVAIKRFIGIGPTTSDGRSLLEGLCKTITQAYGGEATGIPGDYRELIQEFPKRLALATAEKPLILFLDALDQLSDADNSRNLIWLPREIPEHVRLVLSTIPGECLTTLERRLPAANIVELQQMSEAEGRDALKGLLADAGRTLQPDQEKEVVDKFAAVGLPLYLRLAFEEAKRWKSYAPASQTTLAADIPGIIKNLFDRLSLDTNHGKLLVARSLGYLCAAKRGLSEDEMLDVLGRDTEVFAEVKKSNEPPEQRLPVVIWSRLLFDLEPYLTERLADGSTLLNFYHGQLRQAAETAFLGGDDAVRSHKLLAEYFGSKENPWWLESLEAQRARAKRLPPTPRPANIRKVVELPHQLLRVAVLAGKDDPKSPHWDAVADLLTNWEFLEAKTEADPNFQEMPSEPSPERREAIT